MTTILNDFDANKKSPEPMSRVISRTTRFIVDPQTNNKTYNKTKINLKINTFIYIAT